MDAWIHLMHRNIDITHNITFKYSTYWDDLKDVMVSPNNIFQGNNLFIHGFIIKLLLDVEESKSLILLKPFFLSKIRLWEQHIDNPFHTESIKNAMWDIFTKTQRAYYGFSRFARLWKLKRAKIQVECDLCMTPITLREGRSMSIYQNGALYYFTISDLINISNTSLMHSPDFFCDPQIPKNPYTNIPFSKAILYSIYHAIRNSNYRMSNLMHLYYLTEFNINRFYFTYEAVIRDEYIKTFVKTGDVDELYMYIRQMLRKITTATKISVDTDFPKDVLIRIMRPFLNLYLTHSFSLSKTDHGFRSYFELKHRLQKFAEFNPTFGRKLYVSKPPSNTFSKKKQYVTSFVTNHISFYDIRMDGLFDLTESKDDDYNDNEVLLSDPDDGYDSYSIATLVMNRAADSDTTHSDGEYEEEEEDTGSVS